MNQSLLYKELLKDYTVIDTGLYRQLIPSKCLYRCIKTGWKNSFYNIGRFKYYDGDTLVFDRGSFHKEQIILFEKIMGYQEPKDNDGMDLNSLIIDQYFNEEILYRND